MDEPLFIVIVPAEAVRLPVTESAEETAKLAVDVAPPLTVRFP